MFHPLTNTWQMNNKQWEWIQTDLIVNCQTIDKQITNSYQWLHNELTNQITKRCQTNTNNDQWLKNTSQSNAQTGSARTTSNDQLLNNEFAWAIHNYLTYEQQTITINSQRVEQPIGTQQQLLHNEPPQQSINSGHANNKQ